MSDIAELLSRVRAASLVDAMGRFYKHRAHLLDFLSPTPGRVLFGPVATIRYVPLREDLKDSERHNFARLFYEAVGDEPNGKVLVMSSSAHYDISVGGGTKLSRLDHLGLAGVLADGSLRDFDELAECDFVTYCKGETTRWGGDVLMPYAANVPVVVDGVTAVPEDYVYACNSGAVVIPASDVERVLKKAARIEEHDAQFREKIRTENRARIMGEGQAQSGAER